jgi:K+-transporting ATPase ATPase A chain
MKQLATNGGGFYGMNSAHPFENPTDLTNFLSCVAMMLFPFSLVLMYGHMLKRVRHAVVIFSVMMALMIGTVVWAIYFDTLKPNPGLTAQSGGQTYEIPSAGAPGGKRQVTIPSVAGLPVDQHLGNLEGKELRFGTSAGATFSALTVDVTDGAINCEHDSLKSRCRALADGRHVVELHLRRKGGGDDQPAALFDRWRLCGRPDGRSDPGISW